MRSAECLVVQAQEAGWLAGLEDEEIVVVGLGDGGRLGDAEGAEDFGEGVAMAGDEDVAAGFPESGL